MNRESVIVVVGCLVVGGLFVANLRVGSTDRAGAVEAASGERRGRGISDGEISLDRREISLVRSSAADELGTKSSEKPGPRRFESAHEVQDQIDVVESRYRRSAGQAAREAKALFEGMDVENYLRRVAEERGSKGVSSGRRSEKNDGEITGEEAIARAFVRWVQTDPEAAREWALAQDLQPVMTTLMRAGADFAVMEAREVSISWIDGIQSADLKEVAAWSFAEGMVRANPEEGKLFLEQTDWLSPHAKGRVMVTANRRFAGG